MLGEREEEEMHLYSCGRRRYANEIPDFSGPSCNCIQLAFNTCTDKVISSLLLNSDLNLKPTPGFLAIYFSASDHNRIYIRSCNRCIHRISSTHGGNILAPSQGLVYLEMQVSKISAVKI